MTTAVRKRALFFVLAVVGVTADLWSKEAAFGTLGYPGGRTDFFLTGWVKFRLLTSINEGALWGLGQGYQWLFAALSLLVLGAILFWVLLKTDVVGWWLTVTLGFVSGGTLGNLYDRLGWHECVHPIRNDTWYGVRDFLDFQFGTYDYPIFNVADMLLVTGAIMLFIHSFMIVPEPEPKTTDATETG